MAKRLATFIAAATVAACSLQAETETITIKSHPAHASRILVKRRTGATRQSIVQPLELMGLGIQEEIPLVPGLMILDLKPARRARLGLLHAETEREEARRQLLERMEKLRRTGWFEYVEPDYVLRASRTPDDSAFADGTLWGLRNTGQSNGIAGADIGAATGWNLSVGSTNVIVAIIDSGIRYTHHELAGQMWRNPLEIPGNNLDDDKDGYQDDIFGMNALSASGDPLDDDGHGTHLAGIIGAAANGQGPMVGVAWQVRLMACKFLDANGNGETSDAIRCINFAVSKGARIINASFGGDAYSQPLFEAIAAAADRGVLFVASAGNDGANNDRIPTYPANFAGELENVITVTAVDRRDGLPDFANIGLTKVHLGAPGVEIYSTMARSDDDEQLSSGTSQAAAYVSGVAALVLARFPEISVPELRDRLLGTVVPVDALRGQTVTGGRVNAFNALNASPKGLLTLSVSAAEGTALTAGSIISIFVRVTDLTGITNATVSALVAGASVVLQNDGIPPDARLDDATYSGNIEVPSDSTNLTVTILATAPGKTGTNLTINYPVISGPANDRFSSAGLFPPGSLAVTGSNRRATREPGEPNHAGQAGGKSVWWRWTAPTNGPVTLTTQGSDFDTLLAVYTGEDLAALSEVASNDDEDGLTSAVRFVAQAGVAYRIAVDGFGGASGSVALSVAPFEMTLSIEQTLLDGKPQIIILLQTLEGRTVVLEYCSNLSRPEWHELRRAAGDGTRQLFTEPIAENLQRFYRFREE